MGDANMDRIPVAPPMASQDADGDGYTNVEEFLNGTSPVSASPLNPPGRLRIIGASASTNNVTKNQAAWGN